MASFGFALGVQSLTLAAIFFAFIFYKYPEHIVIGTKFSAAVFIFGLVSPYLGQIKTLLPYWSKYEAFYAHHPRLFVHASIALAILVAIWGFVMSNEIVRRYRYVDAINAAVTLLQGDQIDIPAPEDLAKAFALAPDRPEVPFLIARATRILAPDDRLASLYAYMDRFVAALPREKIIAAAEKAYKPERLAVETNAGLPHLNPLELLVQYEIETTPDKQPERFRRAVETLDAYLDTRKDLSLEMYRNSLKQSLAFDFGPDDALPSPEKVEASIDRLDALFADIEAQRPNARPGPLFEHAYQEALDDYADLLMRRALVATTPESKTAAIGPQAQDRLQRTFTRLLLLRRRLMSADVILWWRPPQKLILYHLFGYFGGLPNDFANRWEDRLQKRQSRNVAGCAEGLRHAGVPHVSRPGPLDGGNAARRRV